MNRFIRCARRFFWWCAATDAAILDHPDTPRLDGIKYAAVGALVCLTTVVAICGWTHNAATLLADWPFALVPALGLGLLMGAVVFCMERVLVVSIRQDASLPAKVAAFAWRGLIASLAAALVTTPFALAYFNNGILARLDDEKLALMAAKRQAVESVFRLNDKAGVITGLDRDLAANRAQRGQLPAEVQALADGAAACDKEYAGLRRALEPQIAAVNRSYAALLRDLNENPGASRYLGRRLAALTQQLAGWRKILAAKAQACRGAAEQFVAGRREYWLQLDQEWQRVTARRQQAQRSFDEAQGDAGEVLGRSDAVIARVTAPDLSARIRALGQMVARDQLVLVVILITYGFFFLIDIMPVLAKLVMRTTYDRRISGEYRRTVAKIEGETAIAEADGAMRAAVVEAESAGVETMLCQDGNPAAIELAKLRVQIETEKAEAAAPFAKVLALIDAFERTQARADDVSDRYAARPELMAHIEAVREALARAMRSAADAPETPRRSARTPA